MNVLTNALNVHIYLFNNKSTTIYATLQQKNVVIYL